MTEDMRAEFERTNGRDHRRQPPKGNNYVDPMAQADWESFQKGWAQSRATLEIELPERIPSDFRGDYWDGAKNGFNQCIATCAQCIKVAGLRVKS